MADGRALKVTVDFGAVVLGVIIATAMVITAWNWNSARHDCTQLLQHTQAERSATAQDVARCAKTMLGK
jgi:hypothetical protein